ncbi:hypothetical protein QBC39DRAFT_295021 [Podospora conica]|nr:hypothetical protein QBC39DRAFT_295021 [Schizothecium conicum]
METTNDAGASEPPPAPPQATIPRPRITNACEACRSAKVKCQASNQLGICRRCLDSRRECVFKTGPRTRRPRQPKNSNPSTITPNPLTTTTTTTTTPPTQQPPLPPPPGPSKTFTIDIPTPFDSEVSDAFETLRVSHAGFIDALTPHMDSASSTSTDGDDDDVYHDFPMPDAHSYPPGPDDNSWLLATTAASAPASVVSHASSLPLGASALSTPPSSVVVPTPAPRAAAAKGKTVHSSLALRPQFNLDSAAGLLAMFRGVMLAHFPCVVLEDGEGVGGVTELARERPFVLLAVLAAASSSRSLQGHSLYDEEFRKILGFKFVAGGERSLELLQGLVIYVAWFPFHLRPKNKQAFQYVRMAIDIVMDLELDQDPGTDEIPNADRINQMRLYLATYFMMSHFSTAWNRSPSMQYTEWTARCTDLLLAHSPETGDAMLAWKVRLQRLSEETHELRKLRNSTAQSSYQTELILKGIESQLHEWETKMPASILSSPTIRIALLSTRIFIGGAPLLKISPPPNRAPTTPTPTLRPTPSRLHALVPSLHALFDLFLALPATELNALGGIDWGNLILAVVLGYRLSFPLPDCPEWDDGAARASVVRFGSYLERLTAMGGGDGPAPAAGPQRTMDVLSASKIVLGVLEGKFRKRVAKLEGRAAGRRQGVVGALWAAATGQGGAEVPPPPPPAATTTGCPMLDGSMEAYFPVWDETFAAAGVAGGRGVGGQHQAGGMGLGMDAGGVGMMMGGGGGGGEEMAYGNDLWATISMGWAQDGGVPPGGDGNGGDVFGGQLM